VDAVKSRGVPFIKHCDGYTWPILEQMVSTGVDCINPMEPAAGMDIGEVKKAFGDRVALMGNIDCSHLLSFGTPEEVREAVKECIRAASPGGGHILSSSNIIHDGVAPENFTAMLEAAREFGRYPINVPD
jgi:uroporphyrinogen decarboxylase